MLGVRGGVRGVRRPHSQRGRPARRAEEPRSISEDQPRLFSISPDLEELFAERTFSRAPAPGSRGGPRRTWRRAETIP
ncbi:hypothetical protein GN956_G10381 [Arapaima gigas]